MIPFGKSSSHLERVVHAPSISVFCTIHTVFHNACEFTVHDPSTVLVSWNKYSAVCTVSRMTLVTLVTLSCHASVYITPSLFYSSVAVVCHGAARHVVCFSLLFRCVAALMQEKLGPLTLSKCQGARHGPTLPRDLAS